MIRCMVVGFGRGMDLEEMIEWIKRGLGKRLWLVGIVLAVGRMVGKMMGE
ncbi:hypothetical protein [Bacillus altitudinis]